MSDNNTYQPGWGEKPKHHHHHTSANEKNRGLGGALRMKDKQAYYGLMCIIILGLAFGAYKLIGMFVNELRAMPNDDPTTEVDVDVLRIRKVEEQDALLLGDSLAHEYNVDSMKHNVQIETRPVYRPPKRENTWYLTKREWKALFKNYRIWKRMHEREQNEEEKE